MTVEVEWQLFAINALLVAGSPKLADLYRMGQGGNQGANNKGRLPSSVPSFRSLLHPIHNLHPHA